MSAIFRGLVPVLKSGAKVAVKQAAKSGRRVLASDITKQAISSAKKSMKKGAMNAAINVLEGRNVKEGAKADLGKARRDLCKAIKKGGLKAGGNDSDGDDGDNGTSRRYIRRRPASVRRKGRGRRKASLLD